MGFAISGLELLQPRTLGEALRRLRDEGPLVPLAGCTDLYVGLHSGTVPARRFLDLSGLRALRGIRRRGDTLVIGALATYTDIARSPLVGRRLPILVEAARQVGSPQIRNRGTIGGNVANASPAGDTLPVLAVAEAVVVLRSVDGERRVPFASFCTGYRQTVLRPDELIVAIEVPPVAGRQWFRKVGGRAAQAISKVVVAAVRAPWPRIALGSVAPTVVRAVRTEAVLAAGGTLAQALAALAEDIQPIDDLRSTAAYRRRVSANLLAQFWGETARPRGRERTMSPRLARLVAVLAFAAPLAAAPQPPPPPPPGSAPSSPAAPASLPAMPAPAAPIAVPEGSAPVVTDGLFSPGEWDDARRVPVGHSVGLYVKRWRDVVFIGVRGEGEGGIGPSELGLAAPGGAVLKLHVSSQLSESVLPETGDEPPVRWGFTSGWYANEQRRDEAALARLQKEGRPPSEIARAVSYPSDGIEFAIRRSKVAGDRWLLRVWASATDGARAGMLTWPPGTDARRCAGWAELRLD